MPVCTDMTITSGISPCLWFDDDLEEAARFYTGIFPNSSIGRLTRYNAAGPGEAGKVMAGEFTLGGLKDRFGLSWQIVPTRLYELVSDPDPARARAATRAMLGMRRIVIEHLEAAADAVAAR